MRNFVIRVLAAVALSGLSSVIYAFGTTKNNADLEFKSDLNEIYVTVSQGSSSGCLPGSTFDPAKGGCTVIETCKKPETWWPEVNSCIWTFGNKTETETRPCEFRGRIGYEIRTRTIEVWRRWANWGDDIYGTATEWTAWSSCNFPPDPPDPEPDPVPPVGTTFSVTSGMICVSSDPGYNSPAGIDAAFRNQIINTYRNFSYYGRCPEPSGYTFWLSTWKSAADSLMSTIPTLSPQNAYNEVWDRPGGILDSWQDSAGGNRENTPAILSSINDLCQQSANAKYGVGRVSAEYVNKSGNKCSVTKVH